MPRNAHWYHFTNKSNLMSILREGLRPRGDRPSNFEGIARDGLSLESNPDYVYLTSIKMRPWHCMDYDATALLVIDADYLGEKLMRADEDKARFGKCHTTAYEGVIDSDAVEEVWFFEQRESATGAINFVMVEQDFRDWEL